MSEMQGRTERRVAGSGSAFATRRVLEVVGLARRWGGIRLMRILPSPLNGPHHCYRIDVVSLVTGRQALTSSDSRQSSKSPKTSDSVHQTGYGYLTPLQYYTYSSSSLHFRVVSIYFSYYMYVPKSPPLSACLHYPRTQNN